MNTLHKLILAGILLLTGVGVAWSTGVIQPGADPPHATYLTSQVVSDTVIKAGPGYVQCVIFAMADAAPTAGSITIRDNTTADSGGTDVFTHTFTTAVFMPFEICLQRQFVTGIAVDADTTDDVNVVVQYR